MIHLSWLRTLMLRSLKLRLVLVGTGLKSHRNLLWDLSTIGRSSSGSDWHGIEKVLRSNVFERINDISWLFLRLLLVTGLDVFLSLQHLGIARTQPTCKWIFFPSPIFSPRINPMLQQLPRSLVHIFYSYQL